MNNKKLLAILMAGSVAVSASPALLQAEEGIEGTEVVAADFSGEGTEETAVVAAEEGLAEETGGEEGSSEPEYSEPVAQEQALEEPVAQDQVYEEPASEEPAQEEPAQEEPVQVDPAAEEPQESAAETPQETAGEDPFTSDPVSAEEGEADPAPTEAPAQEEEPTPTQEASPTPTQEATPTPTQEATPTPTPAEDITKAVAIIEEVEGMNAIVRSYDTLSAAVSAEVERGNTKIQIVLTQDENLGSLINIPSGVTLILGTKDGETVTLRRAADNPYPLFTVNGNLQLGLGTGAGSLLIDGNKDAYTASSPLINIDTDGQFVLTQNAALKNNAASSSASAIHIAADAGKVVLAGGEISGNTTTNAEGGAVYVEEGFMNVLQVGYSDTDKETGLSTPALTSLTVKDNTCILEGSETPGQANIVLPSASLLDIGGQLTTSGGEEIHFFSKDPVDGKQVSRFTVTLEEETADGILAILKFDDPAEKYSLVRDTAQINLKDVAPTATPTPTPTNTPVPTPTDTPVPTPTNTPVPSATNTPIPSPTVRSAYEADVKASTVTGLENPLIFTPGTYHNFSVHGASAEDHYTADQLISGDTRWVPLYWSTVENPSAKQQHKNFRIGSSTGIYNSSKEYTLYLFFEKEVYDGTKWAAANPEEIAHIPVKYSAVNITPTPTVAPEATDTPTPAPTDTPAPTETSTPTPTIRAPYIPPVTNSTVTGLESAKIFTPGTMYEFSVTGASATDEYSQLVVGDGRWVPIYWSMTEAATTKETSWKIGSKSGIYNSDKTYTMYVFFRLYTLNAQGQWQATETISHIPATFSAVKITPTTGARTSITGTISPGASGGYNSGASGTSGTNYRYDEDDDDDEDDDTASGSYTDYVALTRAAEQGDATGAISTATGARTADDSPLGTMTMLAALSLLAGGYTLVRRRKKEI